MKTVDTQTDSPNIQLWDDALQVGISLRADLDSNRWALGALVNVICPRRRAGRPRRGEEDHSLEAFASAIGEERSTLSQLAANEEFYSPDVRSELPDVSWSRLARARVWTTWKVGQPVTNELVKQALTFTQQQEFFYVRPERTRPKLADAIEKAFCQVKRLLNAYSEAELGDCKPYMLTAFEALEQGKEIAGG